MAQDLVPDCGLYTYKATIVRVIDGDTVVADIDLGFNTVRRNEHLRLIGVDAPENKTDAGKKTTEALRSRIEGKEMYICTTRTKRSGREATGSFGRYLAEIYLGGENVNKWLVSAGLAAKYDG
ncbi:thermonuclease family protein [uncultured Pelagimonas sp.]|uniref:thermonuclease family protein n=1 Tax=uncultured Pelagimonas sp. TaxID=1618102 RepID=UPI0026088597|nr:thermonuclease family protein [uncultured Pelagimonas sp.]